jgi:aryl-alcohol dehydrogenase-like predicted oxidoreductase
MTDMDQRTLGIGGPSLSVVGLGCNNFGMKLDDQASIAVVHAALDAGITHFDTAEMYGRGRSEEFLGAALAGARDDVVIATKFLPRPQDDEYTPGALATRIREGCEGSLRRLGTDRIDVYYQHYHDPDAPVDEALETLGSLIDEGKVLHVASSNLDAEQIRAADAAASAAARARFCGTQLEWNLLSRGVEEAIVPTAVELGLGIVPYFPLASGMLTGKYQRGAEFPPDSRFGAIGVFGADASDENFARVGRLTGFAESRGHSVLELAIAWLAAHDGVASVIAGATTPEQVRANAAASAWRLDDGDLGAVEGLL